MKFNKLIVLLCLITISLKFVVNETRSGFLKNNKSKASSSLASTKASTTSTDDFDDIDIEKELDLEENMMKSSLPPVVKKAQRKEEKKVNNNFKPAKNQRQSQKKRENQESNSSDTEDKSDNNSDSQSDKKGKTSTTELTKKQKEQQEKLKKIFNSIEDRGVCSKTKGKRDALNKVKKSKEESKYLSKGIPFKKSGYDDNLYGKGGPVAYYFDNLDACWRDQVVEIFKKAFDEAKKLPVEDEQDPYSVENQLKKYHSLGLGSKIPDSLFSDNSDKGKKEQKDTLAKINKNFIADIFDNSISYSQLNTVITEWNWASKKVSGMKDPAKEIIDKYDFDGDGRLNPREFIFFSIFENEKLLADRGTERTNFYDKFIDEVLDPFFSYSDCDGDRLINAENIWASNEKLVCREKSKYDIYACDAKESDSDSDFRTSSVNDFMIKNSKDGYINPTEFYEGILLGFWDRQVSISAISKGDEYTDKTVRWESEGSKDIECEKVKKLMEEINPNYNK